MRPLFQRHIQGQSPLGIFTNIFNTTDRATVGAYLAIHAGHWRLTFTWGTSK